jgi:GntR family transcriptional regulator, transcriptional repressor for pyruvate dehydrogenase complex
VGFERLKRESVADQVFARLRDAVLTGELEPGAALPAERELAERFGVNRQAVREAISRLTQVRLVRVNQGRDTRVEDWRRTAGLDVAGALAGAADPIAVGTLTRDMLEMRALIGADAARLCAERADAGDREMIRTLAEDYAALSPDLDAMAEVNVELWRAIVLGSRNLVYLLSFNSLVGQALAVSPVPAARRTAELLDVTGHVRLATSIGAGDTEEARRQAWTLLGRTVAAMDGRL